MLAPAVVGLLRLVVPAVDTAAFGLADVLPVDVVRAGRASEVLLDSRRGLVPQWDVLGLS